MSLEAYFTDRHDCDIVSVTDDRIELTNIPESGGAHMLPGGFGALSALSEHWDDWDIEYVGNGETFMYGSRERQNVVITRRA